VTVKTTQRPMLHRSDGTMLLLPLIRKMTLAPSALGEGSTKGDDSAGWDTRPLPTTLTRSSNRASVSSRL